MDQKSGWILILGLLLSTQILLAQEVQTEAIQKLRSAEERYGIPKDLLVSIAKVESGLSHYDQFGNVKVGPNGAIGILQIMPNEEYIRNVCGISVNRLYSLNDNIDCGAKILVDKYNAYKDKPADYDPYNCGYYYPNPWDRAVRGYVGYGCRHRNYVELVHEAKETIPEVPKPPPVFPKVVSDFCRLVFGTECVIGNEFIIIIMIWLMIFLFIREVLRLVTASAKRATLLAFLISILIANTKAIRMAKNALVSTVLFTGPFAVIFIILSSILLFFGFWLFGNVFGKFRKWKEKQKAKERAMRRKIAREFEEELGKIILGGAKGS